MNQSASIREDTIGHYLLPVLLPVNERSLLSKFQTRLHISLFFRRSTHCHYAYIYIKRETTRCHLLDHHLSWHTTSLILYFCLARYYNPTKSLR